MSRCGLIVDNSFLLAKFEGLLGNFTQKNSVLSRNPQLHLALHSRFRNFVKKWCGLKVNNYGNFMVRRFSISFTRLIRQNVYSPPKTFKGRRGTYRIVNWGKRPPPPPPRLQGTNCRHTPSSIHRTFVVNRLKSGVVCKTQINLYSNSVEIYLNVKQKICAIYYFSLCQYQPREEFKFSTWFQ